MTNDERELGRLSGLVESQTATLVRLEAKMDERARLSYERDRVIDERLRRVENHKTGEVRVNKLKGTLILTAAGTAGSAITALIGWLKHGGPTP